MAKLVNDSHIIGERGVILFHSYCNSHNPYMAFREITRSDFGIDGEIELVRINEEGKREMTGELIKVQIKSSFGTGYLKKRQDGTFAFYAKKSDLEYWSKYKLDVLLIIYDDSTQSLYARKIDQALFLGAKKKSYPIEFSEDNKLVLGENSFLQKYSSQFKSRVNFGSSEVLTTNITFLKHFPRNLFIYNSKYPNKKEIFQHLENSNEAPFFVCYSKKVITGYELKSKYSLFKKSVLDLEEGPVIVKYEELIKNQIYRRYLVELLNEMIKEFLGSKGIYYNKDYKRFYFAKPKDENERVIEKRSIKTDKISVKKVVSFHKYGKDEFFRHVAFEIDFLFNLNDLYLVFTPKYLFTLDGKATLSPKKITKYTNFLTAREYNDQVLDQLYLIINYLKSTDLEVQIQNNEDVKVIAALFIHQNASFGIPSDIPKQRIKKEAKNIESIQQKLFI